MISLLNETATNVLKLLNEKGQNIVNARSLHSPRAIGDAVQEFLSEQNGLQKCIPQKYLCSFENDFERRSMEDMAFFDTNKRYYAVDCKTHNLKTVFNMPNLISVRRLANFYKNDTNVFCILIVEYEVQNNHIQYTQCHFKPIEAFSWDCLTIGALGWGQIQIANANVLKFNNDIDRKTWMLQLCNLLDVFYDEEVSKIGERKKWFKDIKDFWAKKL
jgi:hypothetical protein